MGMKGMATCGSLLACGMMLQWLLQSPMPHQLAPLGATHPPYTLRVMVGEWVCDEGHGGTVGSVKSACHEFYHNGQSINGEFINKKIKKKNYQQKNQKWRQKKHQIHKQKNLFPTKRNKPKNPFSAVAESKKPNDSNFLVQIIWFPDLVSGACHEF
jgi:hypothetical protein